MESDQVEVQSESLGLAEDEHIPSAELTQATEYLQNIGVTRITESSIHASDTRIQDKDLKVFANFPEVTTISLGKTSIDGSGLKDLNCPQLESLLLFESQISDDTLKQLPVLPKLGRLSLADTNIDGSCLEHVAKFSEIDTLDLAGTKVTDESLAFLSSLKKLKRLDLRGTPITDVGIKHLLNCPELYVVNLSDTGVTDEGAIALTSAFELFRIDLDGTSVSDKLVESLVETSSDSLRILRLRSTKITSVSAPLFGQLEAMTMLDVRDTTIPYGDVAYLEDSLLKLNQPE
ncbi:MAG: hypothetical protein WKF77_24780 [Planctomycetaceae bacterium]